MPRTTITVEENNGMGLWQRQFSADGMTADTEASRSKVAVFGAGSATGADQPRSLSIDMASRP